MHKRIARQSLCSLVAFCFAFAVLVPHPAAAAETIWRSRLTTRASLLDDVRQFIKRDWEQTKEDKRRIGDFFKRDWQRTKEDYFAIKSRLHTLRSHLLNGKAELPTEVFLSHVHTWLGTAIDEMGPKEFCRAVERSVGSDIFSAELESAEPQIARGEILKGLDEVLNASFSSEEFHSKTALAGYCTKAELVVNSIREGATAEEVVGMLLDEAEAKTSSIKASDPIESMATLAITAIGTIIAVGAILAVVAPVGIAIVSTALTIFVSNTIGPVAAIGTAAAGVALAVAVFKVGNAMFGSPITQVFGG